MSPRHSLHSGSIAGTHQLRKSWGTDGLRPVEGGHGNGVCKLSSMGVCPRSGPRPVSLPTAGIYGAGWDPRSPCVRVPVAAGHQGCMRSWSDPSPGCIPVPGPWAGSLQEGAAGGMFLAGLVVGGNGRRGGLVLGVAGPGGARECSVSSISGRVLAAVSRGPASPMGLAPRRQGEGGMLTSKHNMFHKRVC